MIPADVQRARERLTGIIPVTPCCYSETLSLMTGARVHVKLENLQMTGSFKERGAANLLAQLSISERRRGVIAASAGNHGLAVAFHAARLGIAAVIVMPIWAPLIKVMAARRHGAEVVLHGDGYDEAFARAKEIEAERNLVFVHPFDDPRIIAGQGTIGLELLEQQPELDAVIVPVGGGGLIGGIALAVKERRPGVQVIGVQAEEIPAMKAALAAGQRVTQPAAATIADGIAAYATLTNEKIAENPALMALLRRAAMPALAGAGIAMAPKILSNDPYQQQQSALPAGALGALLGGLTGVATGIHSLPPELSQGVAQALR